MKRLLLIAVMLILGAGAIAGLYPRLVRQPETSQTAPSAVARSPEAALFIGDLAAQKPIAAIVMQDIQQGIKPEQFKTGNRRFDGEWAIGTYQMAVMGLGQMVLAHPELREAYLPTIEQCVERLLQPEAIAFGTAAYGENGLAALDSANGHAYLGYVNLALSMLRRLEPNNRFSTVNDRLTEALVRRLKAAPYDLIETYPNEAYPADNAAVLASIALYDRATGKDHASLLSTLMQQFKQRYVDGKTGLVVQSAEARSGQIVDRPRSSGTALSAYFLALVDPALAKSLFQAVSQQQVDISGFVGIREYPAGEAGAGDIDSGTLMFGVSPAATSFAIGPSRLFQDRELYGKLYRTIDFFSHNLPTQQRTADLADSPLQHATRLAMLTAITIPTNDRK
jgi:Linalool dehydratase/isomerase